MTQMGQSPGLIAVASVAAALLATPVFAAQHHEWKGYSETVSAHDAIERRLGCQKGTLISGGYSLDNVGRDKGPFSKIVPVVNAPVPDSDTHTIVWSVTFFNDDAADWLLDFRISLLCE